MATKPKQLLNTQQMIERLGAHYPSPTYGFITQVRSSTGANSARTADAMAMSLWPSRGLHLIGFEVKISRSDWLAELKNPHKAEEIGQFCHQWYVAINDPAHIHEGELPANWGLIVPSGKGMKVLKQPVHNQHAVAPDYNMLAGIFRNIAEQCIPKETLKTVMRAEFEKGERSAVWGYDRLKEDHTKLQAQLKKFEEVAGIRIDQYTDVEPFGKAVKMVLEGKHTKSEKVLEKMVERAENLVKYLKDEGDIWRAM